MRGLRITVYEVLEYLASEITEAEILEDFPDLTREDLKACIAYAADRERRLLFKKFSLTLFDTSDTAYLPRQNQCLCDLQNGSSSFYYLSRPFSNSL